MLRLPRADLFLLKVLLKDQFVPTLVGTVTEFIRAAEQRAAWSKAYTFSRTYPMAGLKVRLTARLWDKKPHHIGMNIVGLRGTHSFDIKEFARKGEAWMLESTILKGEDATSK